jgi:MFS family permease
MPTMSPSTTEKNNSPKSNNNNKNDEESPATIVSNEGEVENQIQPSSLSSQELWNVTCLVLAFSCNVCCLTLVVGGSAVAIKTVGGNDQVAPFGLGVMFLGMSLVSLTCTHWMFEAWGRKKGFFAAVVFGIVGVVIATIACYIESHELLVCSFLFLGAGCGMGMYLRFAAVEVVSPPFRAKAVTWVLAGGCIAAFVGPETAEATRGTVGDEDEQHLTYVGTFWVAGAFYVGMGIFVSLINFDSQDSAPKQVVQQQPPQASSPGEEPKNEEDDVEKPTIEQTMSSQTKTFQWEDLKQILLGQSFIIPVLVATFSWM